MSTPNFKINHRCVVVTDDDLCMGHVPAMDESYNIGSRNFPSYELTDYSDGLLFFKVCITCGYYGDSNIDYCEMEDDYSIEGLLTGDTIYYASKREWFDELMDMLASYEVGKKLSRWKIEKACRGLKLEECPEKVEELVKDIEESMCNKMIDQIKSAYGYEEIYCKGVMSNGEAIYQKVG